MNDVMTDLAESLNLAEIKGIILHIGAGQGARIDTWLATRAKHIYLVEPIPQLADGLKRQAEAEPRLTVIAAALAESSGTVPLNIFNFTELSSIREPGDILNLFPGLRVTARPMVPAVTMDDLTAQLPVPGPDEDLLVIEAPGAEDIVLKGLDDPDVVQRFTRIILHCGADALYQGGAAAAELADRLVSLGYAHRQLTNEDPDFVTGLFTFDRAAFAQKETEARLQSAENQTAALQRQLGDLGAEVALKTALLEQMQTALAEITASAQAQGDYSRKLEAQVAEHVTSRKEIDAKVEWRGNRIKELGAELEGLRAQTAAAADQQAARIAALEADLAARDAALASEANAAEQQSARIAALEADLAARDAALASEAIAADQQAARIAALEADLAARDVALASEANAAEQQAARIAALEADLAARDEALASEAIAADQQAARIAALEADLAARDAALASEANAAEQQSARIAALEADLAARDVALASGANAAEQQSARIAALEADLAARDEALASEAIAADQQAARIAALEADLAARDAALASETSAAEQQTARAAALEAELKEVRAQAAAAADQQSARIQALTAELKAVRAETAAAAENQAARIAALEAELAKSLSAAEEQAARLAAQETELAAALPLTTHNDRMGALKRTLSEREAELKAVRAETAAAADSQAARIAALEADLAEQQAELAKSVSGAEEQAARLAALETDLVARDAALKKHGDEADQQAKRISALETELASALPLATHNDRMGALKRTLSEREAELKAVQQQETTLSLRMLALRDADLADLRARYTRLQADKEEQDQLLQDLTTRLTEASYYLQELEREAPGSLIPVAQGAVKTEAGRKPKKRSK